MRRRIRLAATGLTFAIGVIFSAAILACTSDSKSNQCTGCTQDQLCCQQFLFVTIQPDGALVGFPPDASIDADIAITEPTCADPIDTDDSGNTDRHATIDGKTGICSLVGPQ